MKKLGILAGLLILLSQITYAQSFYSIRQERNLVAIGGFNFSTFLGDLKPKGDIFDPKPSMTLGAMYYFTSRIGARAEFSYVSLAGDDAESDDRKALNLSFTSSNIEFSVTGIFNVFPNGQRFYQRPAFNPYGFIGVGISTYNPKAELNGEKHELRPLMTENVEYGKSTLVVPYGIGGRFMVSPLFNVSVEAGWRIAFTDYMDDVSTVYADKSSSSALAQQLADRSAEAGYGPREIGSIRGNPDKNDGYILYSIKLEYYLPVQVFGNANQRKLYNRKRKGYYRR